MSLTVKLETYEGPLDLLLHLIKKNEVDIYDIPIALITAQYLDYLEFMESLNVEIAGEFLLMAATLTQIKSKMLLPVLNEEEESEDEDPRMAIVRPLLEHMKLKDAAEALERRDILNRDVFVRGVSFQELELDPESDDIIEASLYDLIDAFRRLTRQYEAKVGLEIKVETKTIQERINEILAALFRDKEVSFVKICSGDRSRAELILSFLSILELARIGSLRIYQHQASSDILLFYVENQPPLTVSAPVDHWSEFGMDVDSGEESDSED